MLGLIRLQQLFDAIVTSDLNIEVKVYEVTASSQAVYDQLVTMDQTYKEENKPVLLDIPNDVSAEVLNMQDKDTWRVSFHYVLVGLVSQRLFLALCEGNPLVTGGFLSQRASNVVFDVFFVDSVNKLLNWWWIETPYYVTPLVWYATRRFVFFVAINNIMLCHIIDIERFGRQSLLPAE